jgi:hypothetical protein
MDFTTIIGSFLPQPEGNGVFAEHRYVITTKAGRIHHWVPEFLIQ